MPTFVIFLLCAFLLSACAGNPSLPTPFLEQPTPSDQRVMNSPVSENPPNHSIQPGGPGKTPPPIKVDEPITAISTPFSLEPQESPEPVEPSPGDVNKVRASAFIDSVQLLILESYPVQINLMLIGSLPTPCHKLRVAVDPPDKENRVYIDVYTVVDPDKICIQVIEPFAKTISLGTFPTGHYLVYVNNELVGEFDS